MKKIICLMLAVMMMVSVAAFQVGAFADDDVVEIVWAMQGAVNETEGWMAVVNTANEMLKDDGIKIVVQNIPTANWDEYYQKVTAQIAGGNCPDIGRIAESLMPTVIKKNQVVDLTDLIAADIDTAQYFDTCFDNAGKQNGKVYGLPSGVYHKILYYNKDMFDAAGLEYPSADWNNSMTMDQLVDTAAKLSSGEGADRVYGFYGECDIFEVGKLANDYLYSSDNTYKITDAHREIYKDLDQMLNVDKSMPTPVETQIMGGFDMFCSGKVAMCVEGTWSHQTARAITDFNVGIAASPAIDGHGAAVAFLDNYVVWSGTKHPEEAWKALKAVFSEECFNALAETGTGGVPVNRNSVKNYSSVLIGDTFDEVSQNCFMESLDHTFPMPYNEFQSEVSSETTAALQRWMVGEKDLDAALANVEDFLKEITGA